MSRTARVAKLTKRLRLYLTDTLTRDIKLLTYLLERTGTSVVQAKAKLYDVLLAVCQGMKLLFYDLTKYGRCRRIRGCGGIPVH